MDHQSDHSGHNAFFNNDAFNGVDGFLNNGANDSFDQSWGFGADQYNVLGGSHASWPDAASQQQQQQPSQYQQHSTFRPGARPDQIFSSNAFANTMARNGSGANYGSNVHNFAGYPQQQYNASTIAPSNLNNQANNIYARPNLPTSGNAYAGTGNTVTPDALQSRPYAADNDHSGNLSAGQTQNAQPSAQALKPAPAPGSLPQGNANGNFFIVGADQLRYATKSKGLTSFLDVGQEPNEYPISKSSIPLYFPRKSRNDIKRLLANDSGLSAKLSKKLSKKSGLTGHRTIPSKLDASGKLTTQAPKKADESSSEETSTDDSDESSSDEEPTKPPIPAVRPSRPSEAIRYDTIKSLWRPASGGVAPESIREGVKDFVDILSTIKERWKSDVAAVKQAEDAKKVKEVPFLKERVQSQLEMLRAALRAAVEQGHPDILDHIGQVLPALVTLALALQDRAKEQDYSSNLAVAVLRFLTKCKLLDSALLDKSGLAKLVARFGKRGDDTVKALAKRIENNAQIASKKRREAPKTVGRTSSAEKDVKSENGPRSPQSAAGVKRPRSAESSSDQPAKKVAAKPGETAAVTKKPAVSGSTTANKTAAPAVAKSSSFISSLQSAKRPVAKPATAGQAKPAPNKPPPPKEIKTSTASAADFSFGSLLADVTKPKDERPKAPQTNDKDSSETPEQRARRQRRESRRNLRVSFKPEDSLVEIRVFEHDPDEELGHDASQMRDVNDVGSEGKMFKLHQQNHDMMDIDDEDDEAEQGVVEQTWRAYNSPQDIDFSEIAESADVNYKRFGGPLEPTSAEKAVQEERESNTLLVMYSTSEEIPPSPKEPAGEEVTEDAEPKQFGVPDAAKDRLEEVKSVQPKTAPELATSMPDIQAILSALNSGQAVPAQQNNGQPDLASFMSNMPNMQQQQPFVPPPPPQMGGQQQPGGPDMNAILAGLNGGQNQGQQPPQAAQQPAGQPAVDIQSLLASLTGSQQQQQPPQGFVPPPPPQMGGYPQMPGMPQMNNFDPQNPMWQAAHQFATQGMPNMWQQPQQPQQQGQGAPYENEARKRWREQNEGDDDDGNKRQKKRAFAAAKFKTKVCTFYQEGKCQKGAACTYIHDDV